MKVSKITLPIFLFGLIIFLLTSCAGITPVTPTPSPGTTDEDNTVINGTIKMPFTCCILKSEKQNTKNNSTKTESWAVIPGAVVELKSTENCKTLLDTTISDKSGNYTFKDVKPGIYIITAYCPSDRKYLTKDVVEKPLGQAVDAGTPDCNSTSLALVIEYLKDCYGEDYSCFNKKSSVYNMVKTIAGAVNQLDIDAIENNSNYDELVTMVSDAIYSCCGVISPGTTPSADSGGSSGTPSSVTKTTINAAVIPGIKAPVTGEVPVTTITDIAVKSAVSGSSKSNTQYTGTVSWKPEHDKFQGNTVYTANITLTPKDGYTLSGVPANFFKVEGADSISNPANSGVVTAVFPKTESEKYTVTFPGPDNGSLSAKVDDVAINSGDDKEKGKPVVFTADPDSGYQVKVWKLNNIEVGSTELTYTVSDLQEDITVSVEFELIPANTYEVTFSVKTGNGSIFATDDGTTIASGDAVEEGSKVVFTATPVQDWQIKDWYINGSSIGSTNETYTIDSLSSDINITVEFEEIPPATYEVTFKETNKLDGVSIQLYSDANRTQPLGGPGTTNQNGEAVRTLIDGNYWFTASFNGYEDFEDNFEVNGGDKTVEFEMVSTVQPTGLILWLDAEDYSSGTWPDKSGTGNTVSQNTSGNQPTLVTNGLNGNPVVRFDGSQYLNLDWNLPNSSLTTDAITIFLVLKNDDMNGGTQVVMGNYNSTDEVSISISSQNDSIVARITDYNTSCTFTDQPGPYVLTFDYDSATMRTFVDGLLTDNFSTNEDIDWESTAIGRSGIGTARNWAGDIAEIRIYDSVLSDTERQAIESELQAKWLSGGGQPTGSLVLHLDAADYDASTGSWPDKSSIGNTVSSQSTSGSRPTLDINGLNGNPVVRFDGNDDYLYLNWNLPDDSLSTDSITIFMVLKSNNMNDSQTVMGNYNEPGDICFHVSQNQKALTATVSSRDNRIDIGNSTEPYIATYKVTPTSHTTYVNGIESTTGSLTESIDWGKTTIGKNGGTLGSNIEDWFWSGDIAEIQIYDYALSNNERQAIESDLQSKWLTGGGTGPGPLSDAIVIYADPQNSTNHPATVAHVLTINPHTVLIPGDLVDITSSTTEWNTFNNLVDDYNLLYTTRGNHDGSTNWEGRYDNYYSEDINLGGYTVHLIVLDTNDTSSTYGGMVLTGDIGDTQKAWFEADLLANISADFTIVSFHHPVYSSGSHGDSSALQTKLVPLFENYGVDMVFYGHDHTCEVNTFNDIHYVQTCGGSPRDGSNPNYCLLTVMGNELVGEIYDITGSQLGSSFSSETSGLLTGTIYQQVSLFTDGKNYIITAKDGADYYAVEFNPPAENNYFVLSESVEVIDGIDYGLDGTNIIVDPDDADLVWTATSTSDKYYLENTDYYLYGGNVNPQTGQSSGSGTIDFYNLESSRPCDIDGTNFYAYSSNSGEYYLTFDNITYEFGCSDAKAISQAAEVYIFEETDIE